MNCKRVSIIIAAAALVAACGTSPTGSDDSRGITSPRGPNYNGVMYGSGNRAGDGTLQTEAAADSGQPAATPGGVMYGSGN